MDWRWGLTGLLLFAIGIFFLLIAIYAHLSGGAQLTAATNTFGFIGFLLIGLGLVLLYFKKREY